MLKSIKNIILFFCLAFVAFIVTSCTVPPSVHKRVGSEYEDALSAQDFETKPAGKERIQCIDDNIDALLWRLRVIESAQDEIILSTFDFKDDNSGKDIMASLMNAATRGVQIKILIDGTNALNLSCSKNFKSLIALPNVEARLYNVINLIKPWKINYRMHDKYLIADDSLYILGGRNTNDRFLGAYTDKLTIDRDILVYRPMPEETDSLMQLKNYFYSVWSLPCNKDFTYDKNSSWLSKTQCELMNHYRTLQQNYPLAFQKTDWQAETIETQKITLYTNPIEARNKAPELWYALYQIMLACEDAVIQTPYIVCSGDMYNDLTALCAAGKSVEIITNAVESGANPFGCVDYMNQQKRIFKTGVEVYEQVGSSHTKTILVDDNVSIVGSYNLDMRSTYLDTEMMLVIKCPELNSSLREQASTLKDKSRHAHRDESVSYGEQYEEIPLGWGKYFLYAFLRIMLSPLRHLI